MGGVMDVWQMAAERFAAWQRGFDSPEPWLLAPGAPSGSEFAHRLLRSVAEIAGWMAAGDWDLDDPDDRRRLWAALAAIEASLVPLRIGVAEAMARGARDE